MGIEIAVGAALSAGFSSALAGFTAAAFIKAFAISFVLGSLQSFLSPKPKNNLGGSQIRNEGITQNIRQSITTRSILYGEARIGGSLSFVETTGDDEYWHMVLTLCDHEVQEIGEIWFDDISIPADYLDGSGNVTQGSFSGKARIKKHLGGAGQVADSDLVSETSADSDYVGNGIAYIYVRLQYDRDIFPSGIPNVSAFVKGKKITDPRDSTTRYTANTALFAYDYLTTPKDALTPGVGAATADVNAAAITAAANSCDEFVTTTNLADTITAADATLDLLTVTGVNDLLVFQTGDRVVLSGGSLPGGLVAATSYYVIPHQRKKNTTTGVRIGLATSLANALAGVKIDITSTGTGTITKNAEPRYYGGGIIDTGSDPKPNLDELLSGCGGSLIYIGGEWFIKSAIYSTPTYYFDERHVISKVTLRPKVSMRDRFNLVKGVYVSPLNEGQPSDYPSVANATYATADGGRVLPIDYDLPMTQRPHTAQRLAKIRLEKHRQEMFIQATFTLHAMQVQPGDTLYLSNSRFGWVNKVFEVVEWALDLQTDSNGKQMFVVNMSLQETASAVYDWNSGEETAVDPAPNTNLPNPLLVNPPTGLAVTPVEIRTASGDLTYEFIVSWTPPVDIFVVNGGHYDVEFKKSSETDWQRSFRAEDTDTSVSVKQVEPGISYDVRLRSVNQLGVRSAYNTLFGFTVDSPSGATIRIDYRLVTQATIESSDYGLVTDAADATIDYGEV